MDQDYVPVVKRVARATPLQFFGQLAIKNDRSQFLELLLPLFGFPQKCINLGIQSLFHGGVSLIRWAARTQAHASLKRKGRNCGPQNDPWQGFSELAYAPTPAVLFSSS